MLNSGSFIRTVRCSAGEWVGVWGQGPSSEVEAGGWDEDWEWDVRIGPTSLGGPMCQVMVGISHSAPPLTTMIGVPSFLAM